MALSRESISQIGKCGSAGTWFIVHVADLSGTVRGAWIDPYGEAERVLAGERVRRDALAKSSSNIGFLQDFVRRAGVGKTSMVRAHDPVLRDTARRLCEDLRSPRSFARSVCLRLEQKEGRINAVITRAVANAVGASVRVPRRRAKSCASATRADGDSDLSRACPPRGASACLCVREREAHVIGTSSADGLAVPTVDALRAASPAAEGSEHDL